MKAIIQRDYGPPDQLKLEDVSTPTPSGHDVQVRICASSVNDWDWSLVRGAPIFIRLMQGIIRPKISIPGTDIAGYVSAVGGDVSGFKVGDAVYADLSESGFGGFAEYVCVNETTLSAMPAGMGYCEAAALPHAAMLAIQGLFDVGKLTPSSRLLINGAGGGVGTLAVQIASSIGVKNITGVDHGSKFAMMRDAGFQTCIDYTTSDFTAMGEKYDLILDAKTTRPASHYRRALTPNGIYATVGGDLGKLLRIALAGLFTRNKAGGTTKIVALKPNKDMAYLNELYQSGAVKLVIDRVYSLAETPQALQRFGEAAHQGKIIISIHARDR